MFRVGHYSRIKKIVVNLLVLSIVILIALLIETANAESEKVEIEIFPASVELPSTGKEMQMLVVLKNPSKYDLYNVSLSSFSNTSAVIKVNQQHLDSLASNAELVWNIKLSQQPNDLVSGKVYFRVDYAYRTAGTNSKLIPKVLIKYVEVKNRKISSIEQIADVEIKTTLESLNENRPGIAYLLVKNKSDVSIDIQSILPIGPEFICFQYDCLESTENNNQFPETLFPHKTKVISIPIIAKARVKPGRYLLSFDVQLTWREANEQQRDNLVVTQEVNVGVFGESEILKLLGLPSFLLLPGFLIINTIGLLWNLKFLRFKTDVKKFPLEVNTPEFWLISITLSGLVAFGYILTGHNYLESYGLKDIAYVWLFSVFALGLGGYILIMLTRNQYVKMRTPSQHDKPITIIKKLHRLNLNDFLERVNISDNSQQDGFLITPPATSVEKIHWVIPPVALKYLETPPLVNLTDDAGWIPRFKQWMTKNITYRIMGNPTTKLNRLKREIQKQRGKRGRADKLAEHLQEGKRSKLLTLEWEDIGWIQRPTISTQFKDELKRNERNLSTSIIDIIDL